MKANLERADPSGVTTLSGTMLPPETIDATARACFEMQRRRARYRPLDAAVRAAPLDAYRIQNALHRLMSEAGRGEIAGWKIALTSKVMQQMTGVDQPAAGAIFSTVVHSSPAQLSLAGYRHLGVEFEVAVRLGDDLPVAGGPWTRERAAAASIGTQRHWTRISFPVDCRDSR